MTRRTLDGGGSPCNGSSGGRAGREEGPVFEFKLLWNIKGEMLKQVATPDSQKRDLCPR